MYHSERATAESSNYDDESSGQGASLATDTGNLQTDSVSHQFVPLLSTVIRLSILRRHCGTLLRCGGETGSSPPHLAVLQQPAGRSCRRGSSFGSQELLPANVSSLAETLHGRRLSFSVTQRSQIIWTYGADCRRLCWSTTKDTVRWKLNDWKMRRFRWLCSRVMNFVMLPCSIG